MAVGKSVINKSAVVQQQQQQQHHHNQQQQQQRVLPQRRKSEPAKQKSFNSTQSADGSIKHYRQLCVQSKKMLILAFPFENLPTFFAIGQIRFLILCIDVMQS